MDWDLQQYLSDMRREARQDTEALHEKIDGMKTSVDNNNTEIRNQLSAQDKRLAALESTHKLIKWAGGLAATVGLGAFADWLLKR